MQGMATLDDVRAIARALPETVESDGRFGFAVMNRGKAKSFVWSWNERVEAKKPRVENLGVVAIRVAGEEAKQFLIGAAPGICFTEPHYDGFPAILVRLEPCPRAQLEDLLVDGWRIQAPKALVRAFEARVG